MSSSAQDLQKHVGRPRQDVKQELESQGYTVHEVRTGKFATGYVPARVVKAGQPADEQEKRAVFSYDGNDPDEKVTSIRED